MEITLGPTSVELLPDRAVFLPSSRTLVVADLHLGKSATFRTRGLPVPEGSTAADLDRLTTLIGATTPQTLVIAGDLLHSRDGLTTTTLDLLRDWLQALPFPVILTEGNHDSRSSPSRLRLPLEIFPQWISDELVITHDPDDLPPDRAGIAGHLHPGLRLSESRRSSLRVPGFHLRKGRHLVLPAFSEFTGLQLIKPTAAGRFFTPLGDKVTEIPVALLR